MKNPYKELALIVGATQGEMAKMVGCSRASWNYWERGTATPTLQMFLRIHDKFGHHMNLHSFTRFHLK
jgi:DNA-binding XRE family transcriptional regulator